MGCNVGKRTYIIHYTLYIIHYTFIHLYIIHLYIIHLYIYTLYIIHLYIIHYTLNMGSGDPILIFIKTRPLLGQIWDFLAHNCENGLFSINYLNMCGVDGDFHTT